MIIDPHHQLKTDLYTTVPDLLICDTVDLPYRLILWGDPISHDEAVRRTRANEVKGWQHCIWENPCVAGRGTVSVIETDDKNADRTIAYDRHSTCFRVITPAQAEAEEAKKRSIFPWRLMCRTRPPVRSEFDHVVEPNERLIAYHTGYRADGLRWAAPDICWLGTIYAIHVRDHDAAVLLKMTIGDCDLEGPGAA